MNLLSLIKNDVNARKVFGQRELKIIEKQLLGVNLTQSEKNRLSRDIRKKLEFIREISRFSADFDLKKGAEIKRKIEDVKENILSDDLSKNIVGVVLYGSAADNTLTLSSDIDIAVKFDSISLADASSFRKRILGRVSERVDVQVYNQLPEKIKKEIDLKGRLLYERSHK